MLVRSRAVSEEEVDTRVSDQRQAQESVQAARAMVNAAQLNVEFTQVRAPISGRISRNLVSVGNLINGGTTQSTLLTTIVSLDPIYCYFEADERSYLKGMRQLRNGDRANGRGANSLSMWRWPMRRAFHTRALSILGQSARSEYRDDHRAGRAPQS